MHQLIKFFEQFGFSEQLLRTFVSLPYFPLGENGVILSPVRYPAKNVIAVLYFLAKSVIV